MSGQGGAVVAIEVREAHLRTCGVRTHLRRRAEALRASRRRRSSRTSARRGQRLGDLDTGAGAGLSGDLSGEASQAKEKFDEFLGQAVEATDTLIAAIDEAGVPDVDGGEDIADALKETFAKAKEALEDAQVRVADLPEDDPAAFSEQASTLGTDIQTAMGDLGTTLEEAPEELTQAAEDEPACQEVGG